MQTKLKKLGNAIMPVIVVAGLLAGCGNGGDNGNNANNGKNAASPEASKSANTANTEKAAAKPVEITWGIHFQAQGVVEDSAVQKWLEEKFNVKIKPVKVTDASIASGEIPDIFMLGDPSNVSAYMNQGVLMDIDPNMLKEKMPEYSKDIEKNNALFQTVTVDDKLWAIPMFIDLKPYDLAMLWRKDWLDKVGITKAPETLDEFEKAVYAFAEKDPDGNGKKIPTA